MYAVNKNKAKFKILSSKMAGPLGAAPRPRVSKTLELLLFYGPSNAVSLCLSLTSIATWIVISYLVQTAKPHV